MAIVLDGTDPIGDLGDALNAKLNLAGGKVLQIVRATDATGRGTTSTSFVDASISVTITPQRLTSAIILIWSGNFSAYVTSGTGADSAFAITDSSNNIIGGEKRIAILAPSGEHQIRVNQSVISYSTPNTTSPITYKGRFRKVSGVIADIYNNHSEGQLFAIEVSA